MTRYRLIAVVAGLLLTSFALPGASASQIQPAAAAATPAPGGKAPDPKATVFKDVPADHWAAGSILMLYNAGVVKGDIQGRFRPEDPVTRAELFKMALAARRLDPGTECQGMFRDVVCDSWYAPVAETAYRMAIGEGTGVDLFSPEAYVDRQQLFTVLVRALGRWWEASSLGWTEINARLRAFSDAAMISDWARPPVALAVGEKLAGGYADGRFRPKALASRAEAAALISRVLLKPDGLQTVKLDGRTLTYKASAEMTATMYATGEPGVGTITYTGLRVRLGSIAVDPKVIPLGSLLYVEGYGYGIAADIGGAIKGKWVDLFTFNHDLAAYQFGKQKRKVYILP